MDYGQHLCTGICREKTKHGSLEGSEWADNSVLAFQKFLLLTTQLYSWETHNLELWLASPQLMLRKQKTPWTYTIEHNWKALQKRITKLVTCFMPLFTCTCPFPEDPKCTKAGLRREFYEPDIVTKWLSILKTMKTFFPDDDHGRKLGTVWTRLLVGRRREQWKAERERVVTVRLPQILKIWLQRSLKALDRKRPFQKRENVLLSLSQHIHLVLFRFSRLLDCCLQLSLTTLNFLFDTEWNEKAGMRHLKHLDISEGNISEARSISPWSSKSKFSRP